MKIKPIILMLLTSVAALAQDPQKFPKLMRLINGKVVSIQYTQEGGLKYLDWTGKVVPELNDVRHDELATKFLYVDSTGKPINNVLYDQASPFFTGKAVIETPHHYKNGVPRRYAIINEKGDTIVPFTDKQLNVHHSGMVYMTAPKGHMELYNPSLKKVTECDCQLEVVADLKQILMMPRQYTKDEEVVRILDFEGKEIYSRPGAWISRIDNNISTDQVTASNPQPYYSVNHSLISDWQLSRLTIVSREGKVVYDSIKPFIFNHGRATIRKKNRAELVDTNFKVIMPFSLGYESFEPTYDHPENVLIAKKNGKFLVVTTGNKIIIPPVSATHFSYLYREKVYDVRDSLGNMWVLSLKGDTIVSPLKYDIHGTPGPPLDGYFVKCKEQDQVGYVSDQGKLVIPCEYDNLGYGGKDLILFFKGEKAGYMDAAGNVKISLENCLKLSGFVNGYAICGIKVTDRSKMSYGAQSVHTGQESYQVHNKVIDSTGKFVSEEAFDWVYPFSGGYAAVMRNANPFMIDKNLKPVTINDSYLLMTYFYKGYAMAYDPKKNTWGVVNEKLEVIVPVIYDKIETKEQEDRRYGYSVISKYHNESYPGFTNYYADIRNGKLKVTLKGKEQEIEVK